MYNGYHQNIDAVLMNSFESGYSNASTSLTQLTRCQAGFSILHHGCVSISNDLSHSEPLSQFLRSYIMLTTDIFGDVTGKSYLLIPDCAFDILTSTVPSTTNSAINFKEEFIKELGNILSAAVLTKLSNILLKKMFGDVPELVGKVNCHLNDLIYDDFSEELDEVYINCIHFTLKEHTGISPLFVWVLDKSSLDEVQ